MANFLASDVLVYPSANSSIKAYKVNSEERLSNISKDTVRNRVIEGLDVTISGNDASISEGKCIISGYQVEINKRVNFSSLSSFTEINTKYWVYLELSRQESGNLNGIEGNVDNQIYLGLNILINQDTPPQKDTITIGYLFRNSDSDSWEYKKLIRSKTNLRAQDIYVEGASWAGGTSTAIPDDPAPDNEGPSQANYLTKSGTLDEVLANLIISDGQFN